MQAIGLCMSVVVKPQTEASVATIGMLRILRLFKWSLRIAANAFGDLRSIPIFDSGLKQVQIESEKNRTTNAWVVLRLGSSLKLVGNSKNPTIICFFSRQEYDAEGRCTRWKNVDVKGT